jgi:hypothetical protein
MGLSETHIGSAWPFTIERILLAYAMWDGIANSMHLIVNSSNFGNRSGSRLG